MIHDKGNEENLFDRVDFQLSQPDSIHINLGFTRSWFQTPNAFDNLNVVDQNGNPVGSTDQRSQIKTFNIAPSWTRALNPNAVFTLEDSSAAISTTTIRVTIPLLTSDRFSRRRSLRIAH